MVVEAKKGSAGGCCTTISELVSEGSEPTESPASLAFSSTASAAATESNAAHQAFGFTGTEERVLAIAVLDVNVEGLALEEGLQVGVVLKDRVICGLADLSFQSHTARLDEVGVEPTNSLLLRRRWDYNTRVVGVQLLV